MAHDSHSQTRRRDVLKLASGSLIAGNVLTMSASAQSKQSLTGFTYDTLTHKTGSPASGRIIRKDNSVSGSLTLAGFKIDLSQLEKQGSFSGRNEYFAELQGSKYTRNGRALKISLKDNGHHISGILRRAENKFGKLGFVLDSESNMKPDNMMKSIEPDQRWEQSGYTFKVPNNGLPTDSGIKRIHNILKDDFNRGEL